jgi:quercetin dioxygenase-like cupin family protein
MSRHVLRLALPLFLLVPASFAKDQPAAAAGCSVTRDRDVTWVPGPASVPAGAMVAVLEGDPAQAGPFTMRIKFAARTRIPAHTHPAAESVVVVRGRFGIGCGDRYDEDGLQWLGPGDFFTMAAGAPHFGFSRTESVIEIHATGPWGLDPVEPAPAPAAQP